MAFVALPSTTRAARTSSNQLSARRQCNAFSSTRSSVPKRCTATASVGRSYDVEVSAPSVSSSSSSNEVASVGVVTVSARFNTFCRENWQWFAGLEVLALVGATYTGILASKRKKELEEMNQRLRSINAKLRHQAEEVEEAKHDPIREAKALLRAGNTEEAIKLFQEGVDKATDDPSLISARKGLARAYLSVLKTDKAIEELEIALTHDLEGNPNELEDIYGLLGDCYTEIGDLEKAMHFYDKCVELD